METKIPANFGLYVKAYAWSSNARLLQGAVMC